MKSSRFGLASGLLVAGCFSASDGGGGCQNPQSLTGNGRFDYVCVTAADPACPPGVTLTSNGHPIPDAVALGAQFGLSFSKDDEHGDDGGASRSVVRPVSTSAVEKAGVASDAFVATRVGRVGFVVDKDDRTLDAIRVNIVEPKRINIVGIDPSLLDAPPKPVLSLGRTWKVAIAGEDEQGKELAGTLSARWSIDDETIATISTENGALCTLTHVAEGKTTLRAEWRGLRAEFEVVTGLNAESDAGLGDGAALPDGGHEQDAGDVSDAASDAGGDL